MPKLLGIRESLHVEHCFVFDTRVVGREQENEVRTGPWINETDNTLIITAVHTGCSLVPSNNEFQLRTVGGDVKANITFDTFAAFFPRKWDGLRAVTEIGALDARIHSYVLKKPVPVATRDRILGVLVLPCASGFPDKITITCAGIISRDIL